MVTKKLPDKEIHQGKKRSEAGDDMLKNDDVLSLDDLERVVGGSVQPLIDDIGDSFEKK